MADRAPAERKGGVPGSALLAAGRAVRLISMTLATLAVHSPRVLFQKSVPHRVSRRWHERVCRTAGVEVRSVGAPSATPGTIFVANHVSYIDIVVLGSLLECSFVAKSDVAGWPVFGFLAKLQKTVFVERRARQAAGQRDVLKEHLQNGGRMILFPEGTSSDGSRVLPFKSSLFEAANAACDGRPVTVQPVSLAYNRFDNMPMERWMRPYYAWYGDMEMGGHLWTWLGLGRLGVDVIFHEPVTMPALGSRKALAKHCEDQVADGVSAGLSGRLPQENAVPANLSPALV